MSRCLFEFFTFVQIQPLILTTPATLPGTIRGLNEALTSHSEESAPEVGSTQTSSSASTDEVTISPEAQAQSDAAELELVNQLTKEEQQQVKELKSRDREVRTHEQAHLAAAGPYARGGPSFTTQTGPDGKEYAVGGEVSIDTSPIPDDPEATLRKAQTIRAAALAPAEPSGQDQAVAAAATKLQAQALKEIRLKEQEEETASPESPQAAQDATDLEDKLLAPASPLRQSQAGYRRPQTGTLLNALG